MRASDGRVAVAVMLALSIGCAGRRSTVSRNTDRNLITREQLQEHRFNTAYEAVESLHSNWLLTRGVDSFNTPSQIWVYLDQNRLGGVATLRELGIASIESIRWFDGVAANARWGVGHSAGVILVSTHRQ